MSNTRITLYVDGAVSGNPGPGGYAAILVAHDAQGQVLKEREIAGGEARTSNNRMEITAVIAGLQVLTRPTSVTVISDSSYVVKTMRGEWKRKKNLDLWQQLDALCSRHQIAFEWVRGHNGHVYNERCDRLAAAERERRKVRH